MLYVAIQVLVFGIIVDEGLGCCGLFPTGRSLLDARGVSGDINQFNFVFLQIYRC